MKIKRIVVAGTALTASFAATLITTSIAQAATAPPSAQYFSLQFPGDGSSASQTSIGSFSDTALQSYSEASATGTASTSITMLPSPTITASTSLTVTRGVEGYVAGPDAFANYYYWATVAGPTNDNVPLDLSYRVFSTISGPYVGSTLAQLGMFSYVPPALYDIPTVLNEENGTESKSGSISYLSIANTSFVVGGRVTVETGGYTGYASITLDPILTIDPSFAEVDPNYLKDYYIELSPGVGNALSAVPEPATWAMTLVGIGGIGFAMRRSRRTPLSTSTTA
jgi:hypothetical protein